MTVCVGSTDEWREAGKIGLRAQRLAYISHTPSPHDYTIQTFFFTTQWAVFFPCVFRELCKWWRDPFFSPVAKRRKDWSERNASSFFFFLPPPHSACEPFMSCGPGVSALRPCERMTVAARAGGGGGSAHNDIHEELRRQPGKECWPCCWTAWHWLMRERKTERK